MSSVTSASASIKVDISTIVNVELTLVVVISASALKSSVDATKSADIPVIVFRASAVKFKEFTE